MNDVPERGSWVPRILVAITQTEDGKRLEEILTGLHIPICYQCRGKGTAPTEMLDLFGLGGAARLVTVAILSNVMAREAFDALNRGLAVRRRGRGIAVTIPVTGLQSPLMQLLSAEAREAVEQKAEERITRDMAEMQEKAAYAALLVAVASGYSEDVVEAARSAGARGGTVLKGRRKNSEQVSAHFGVALQEEQELVVIVVPRAKKTGVMSAISSACGLKTQAHGVVIALPVDEAIGLET